MNFFNWPKRLKTIKRAKQIVGVIGRYGLGFFLDRSKLRRYFKEKVNFSLKEKGALKRLTLPQRARLAFEELGPTFVKLGQVLSTRPDLIPPKFAQEFSKLQDEASPFDFKKVERIIESEFKRPIKELFAEFEEEPVAAASLSQVHKAKLFTGEVVAVKIQRPNVGEVIETDLAILSDLAGLLEKRFAQVGIYQPTEVIKEFSRVIKRELNFIQEGHNLDKFRMNFRESTTVYVPKVFWDLTTSCVLTMEYIDGIKISEIERLKKAGFDLKKIAEHGVEAILKQIFEDGFFHADPHPANLFVLPKNVIVMLDCGMVGVLDEETILNLAELVIGGLTKNGEQIIKALEKMEIVPENVDRQELFLDIKEFIDKYYTVSLKEVEVGKLGLEIIEVAKKHRAKVPAKFALLTKAIAMAESVGKKLNPDFQMTSYLKPYLGRLTLLRYSPKRLIKKIDFVFDSYFDFFIKFPQVVNRLLEKIETNQLNLNLRHQRLESLVSQIDRSSNRVSVSLIIASIVIASSLITQTGIGPFLFGLPAIGVLGYLIAAILGFWFLIQILRSKKY